MDQALSFLVGLLAAVVLPRVVGSDWFVDEVYGRFLDWVKK